ncbi:endoplasmic reticulum metallopeptidase 1-like [Topomyia yanbarensis]|uniref:endoplasmic reticulum metallopeptidase 1-like n=1 Tax=Topomyia yanbarensis TaxID=2498891 RepID=UPI00273A910F|nr:endoplasmic reticulum metallopeptidase 1-like [Topomyia yanbarensis]
MAKLKKIPKAEYFRIDHDANNLHRVDPRYGLLIVLLVLAGGAVSNYFLTHLPDALTIADLEQYPTTFIAERAWNNLKSFTDLGPRVAGTKANDELAVAIFKREIEAIQATKHADQKVVTENQIVTGVFNFTFYGTSMTTIYRNVQNVVVKLVGESEDALLLNCHFDSVPSSPGASDDVASCAVMLEILRVMSRTPERNKHSIIFLFNGAEETLLQASHGFITQHPWAKQVKAFLNLESAGSGGKEVLFQSGPNRAWMVDIYAKTVRYPFAQAMAEELFKTGLIPSDTDFRIFRDYGEVPGMDLAHFLNGYRYHTKYDSLEYLSLPVLQHTGDNMLALTRGMANCEHLSAAVDEQGSSAVFYDFLGVFFLNYSSCLAKLINTMVALLAVLIPYLGLSRVTASRDNRSIWKEVWYEFLAVLIGTLLSLATTTVLARQMEAMDKLMTWYSNRWLVVGMYCVPALVVHSLVQMFFNTYFENRQTTLTTGMITQSKLIGVNVFWSIASLSLTFAGYRCAYIFMIPQLCSLLSSITNGLLAAQRTIRKWIVIHLLFQFVTVVWASFYYIVFVNLFIPITGRSGHVVNPDFIIGTVAGLCVLHTCSYLFPLLTLVRKPSQLVASFSTLALLTLLVACLTPIGFPYRDATNGEPTTQRHIVTHTLRVFHDDIGLVKHTDNGFLFETMDSNGARTLRQYIASDDSFSAIEKMKSCKSELFCAVPFDAMWRQMHFDHFWQSAETAPVIHNMFTLAYEGKEQLSDRVQRIKFKAEGSLQSAVFVGPKPGVKMIAWSLQDVVAPPVTFNGQQGFFVYITHGVPSGPWNITMDFECESADHDGFLAEFGVVTKFWEYHEMHTAEFKRLLEKFPPWTNVIPSVAVLNMFVL